MSKTHVIIVGGGFAGLNCAHKLVDYSDIHITLIDKNNYHEFTPLLYQIVVSALPAEAAVIPFRRYFAGKSNLDVKMAHVVSLEPETLTVHTEEGEAYTGDYLVLALGNRVNFFNTIGAAEYSFPLYTLMDAERLRSHLLRAFEDADRNPLLIDQGILNFVIVGAGPTGTEVAGALADLLHFSLPKEFEELIVKKAQVYLVNHGPSVLNAFSEESQQYAEAILQKRGIRLVMGISVDKISASGVELSNGKSISSKTVIWAGGLKAPSFAEKAKLPQGHSGRIITGLDLRVEGFPHLYALGDLALFSGPDGKPLPQLASVAKQAGVWAAKNILAQIQGKQPAPFQYRDKGIMAMIGKNAAVVEMGKKRREFKGFFAYLTWLSVHVALLPTFFQKVQALIGWFLNYFGRPAFQILDGGEQGKEIIYEESL